MRKIGLFLFFLLWYTCSVQAQDFDELFNAFVSQNQQQFDGFEDSINAKFAKAISTYMKTFVGEQPKVKDTKPKPRIQPEMKKEEPLMLPEETEVPPTIQKSDLEPDVLETMPQEEPALPKPPSTSNPVVEQPLSQESKPKDSPVEQYNYIDFSLFGEKIQWVEKSFPNKLTGITSDDVSEFWVQLSECDYEEMLQRCRETKQTQNFNDWAVFQLVLSMAQQTYDLQYNEQVVFAVFMLNQLGMAAKVGFSSNHLFCLVAVAQQLYGIPYIDIANNRYYFFELNPTYDFKSGGLSFRTYDLEFPKKTQSLDMNIRQSLRSVKTAISEDSVCVNANMIELFKTYPQVEIDVYANAVPSEIFCHSIEQRFHTYIHTQSIYDDVSFLLSYMHSNFDYSTDTDQFGYEKPFFCEENYYYPKNDCEDRSVLFSFLVRYLLHLDVVLVDYPGHIAVAVNFPMEVGGESVQYNGKKYVICDPTYNGASIGMEMSGFSAADRTIIPLYR